MATLSKSQLQRIEKGLRQIGVAMFLVGAGRAKLVKMASTAIPVRDALLGTRPEIKVIRDRLTRGIHNATKSRLDAPYPGQALHALADVMLDAIKLHDRGGFKAEEKFLIGPITLLNSWGYKAAELAPFKTELSKVKSQLEGLGVGDLVFYGGIELAPERAHGRALHYSWEGTHDEMISDPSKVRQDADSVIKAFGERLWWSVFNRDDREVWGGAGGLSKFLPAFRRHAQGHKQPRDTEARLEVTVGRHAEP